MDAGNHVMSHHSPYIGTAEVTPNFFIVRDETDRRCVKRHKWKSHDPCSLIYDQSGSQHADDLLHGSGS